MKKLQIGIIGNAGQEEYPVNVKIPEKVYSAAYKLGKKFAENNCIIVTGGKSGIMEEASKGCKDGGSISVGVVTGNQRFTSNRYVDVEVVSGMYNCGEEMTLVTMCDAIVVLGGGAGTLQEVCIAYRSQRPIYALKNTCGWARILEEREYMDERKRVKIKYCENADELVTDVLAELANSN